MKTFLFQILNNPLLHPKHQRSHFGWMYSQEAMEDVNNKLEQLLDIGVSCNF